MNTHIFPVLAAYGLGTKSKFKRLIGIFTLSFAMVTIVAIAIWLQIPQSVSAKQLASFLLLSYGALAIVAAIGTLVVLLQGYLQTRLARPEKRSDQAHKEAP